MPRTPFNKLSSREKWERYETLKGKWYCPRCRHQTDKPYRASPFPRAEVCCGYCDYTLTCRTGGGQGDPFNWHYGKPPIPHTPDIIETLRKALTDHLGPKRVPRKDNKVTSGATYQIPLTTVANKCGIDTAQLSRFLHKKSTLSLTNAAKLATYLNLKLVRRNTQ
jgi:hypothetical protein